MNLSFIPGALQLTKNKDGTYVISIQDDVVSSTKNQKKALATFNNIRKEMELQYPAHELSREEKTKVLLRHVTESRVGLDHNSYRPQEKKKKGSTRTFG